MPNYLQAETAEYLGLEDGSGRYLLNESPIVITPTVLPHATNGVPYAQQLVATGTPGPYVFSVVFGALPAGLTLSPAGLIAGTVHQPEVVTWTPATIPDGVVDAPYPPTTLAVAVTMLLPPATFTVRATDVSALESLLAEDGTWLLLEDGGRLLLEDSPLLYGEQAYTLTIDPDWTGPIQYTCSPRVPACMSFSPTGVLSGTPMQVRSPGPWTVTATDADGHTRTFTYTLTVRPSL